MADMLESRSEKSQDGVMAHMVGLFAAPKYVKYCPHCDHESRLEDTRCQSCDHCPMPWESPVGFVSDDGAEAVSRPSWEPSLSRPQHFYEAMQIFRPSAPTHFACFSRLPLELRLLVWRNALPGPRAVYIYPLRLKSHQRTLNPIRFSVFETPDHPIKSGYGWKSPSFINIMYVCREAYGVVSSKYTKAFGTDDAFPQTWFNFDIDTLYLEWSGRNSCNPIGVSYLPQNIWSPDFTNVNRLAIYIERLGDNAEWYYETLFEVVGWHVFPNVALYSFVHRRYDAENFDNLTLIDIVDIDSLLSFCSQPFDPTGESARRYEKSWGAYYFNLRWCIPFDAEPNFRHKLVTTPAMAARIEEALENYRRKRISYKTSHPKTAADPRPVLGNGMLFKVEDDIDILQRSTVVPQPGSGL